MDIINGLNGDLRHGYILMTFHSLILTVFGVGCDRFIVQVGVKVRPCKFCFFFISIPELELSVEFFTGILDISKVVTLLQVKELLNDSFFANFDLL